MDADETRIITVFGAEEVPEVSKENLLKYRQDLFQHLSKDNSQWTRGLPLCEDLPPEEDVGTPIHLIVPLGDAHAPRCTENGCAVASLTHAPRVGRLCALLGSRHLRRWHILHLFLYSFTSNCSYPIWIGQRSTGDSASYPPQGDNWTLAAACTTNADCASGTCDQDSGQCGCNNASQCSGGAACLANGKCSTSAPFCMPKNWKSGTFWPRTGCVLDESVSPATLTCETGGCYDTSNTGQQLLDCSLSNRGGSPTNPATQFEVTSMPTSLNYDVSIAAGFNVESYVAPVGGGWIVPGTPATDIAACLTAGCKADLNATCPADLKVVSSDDSNKTIGCLDPCT